MASYDERRDEADRDQRYLDVRSGRIRIEAQVQALINEMTALHAASPLAEEKASIITQRDMLVSNLRAILGV